MKLPRDLSGPRLLHALRKLGYEESRQKGSHVRVTTLLNGEHHEVIPNHETIRIGTLHKILKSVASHHKLTLDELIQTLDL